MPKIYVASLSDYNNGRLHGSWIDATQDVDDIHADIQEILRKSKDPFAEEWAIHDYEGFGLIKLSEYEQIERVAATARLIEEKGEAFQAWYDAKDGDSVDIEDLEETFDEQSYGVYDSERDFAQEFYEDVYNINYDNMKLYSYIDWDDVFNGELRHDFTTIYHNGSLYVFSDS